jgi:predicted DNA-binding transcriptional regulator AlpA
MATDTTQLPNALTARQCAHMLGIGLATWYRRDGAALCPRAIRHGRTTRWARRDIELWIELGCPNRAKVRNAEEVLNRFFSPLKGDSHHHPVDRSRAAR